MQVKLKKRKSGRGLKSNLHKFQSSINTVCVRILIAFPVICFSHKYLLIRDILEKQTVYTLEQESNCAVHSFELECDCAVQSFKQDCDCTVFSFEQERDCTVHTFEQERECAVNSIDI